MDSDFIRAEDRQAAVGEVQDSLARANIRNIEYTLRTQDGRRVPVESNMAVIMAQMGSPRRFSVSHAISATASKPRKGRYGESEERYRRLVELSPEALIVHSDEKIVYINTTGTQLLGADNPEDLIGRSLWDFVQVGQPEATTRRSGRELP